MNSFLLWRSAALIWLATTAPARFVNGHSWVWPTCQILHFLGLCLLFGTVGVFDMRLLGLGKGLSLSYLRRFTYWGIAGFAVNLITGAIFFVAQPYNFMPNDAFTFKLLFIFLAGINMAVFSSTVWKKVEILGPGDDAPLAAKVMGGASLLLWTAVICAGRMLSFFRHA